jgi:hypothetical protein
MWAGTEKWHSRDNRKMSGAGKKRLSLAEMREIEAKESREDGIRKRDRGAEEPESLFSNA